MFAGIDLNAVLEPSAYIGLAPQQVDAFVRDVVAPVRSKYLSMLKSGNTALRV
jgi:adenylosuccinate lyase